MDSIATHIRQIRLDAETIVRAKDEDDYVLRLASRIVAHAKTIEEDVGDAAKHIGRSATLIGEVV